MQQAIEVSKDEAKVIIIFFLEISANSSTIVAKGAV